MGRSIAKKPIDICIIQKNMGTGGSGTTQLDKTKDKQLGKHNHINNYFKCKWTKHYVKGRDS